MADSKISALAALTALASDDEFVVVDKSDTTMAASGTTKCLTVANIDTAALINPMVSGSYYGPHSDGYANTTLTLDRLYYVPFICGRPCTLDRIRAHLGAVSASMVGRMGIYLDSTTTPGKPDALLLDAGTVDGSATTGIKAITISQAVQRGLLWLAFVQQGASGGSWQGVLNSFMLGLPQIATWGGQWSSWSQNTVTGALPANASGLVSTSQLMPAISVRVA